MAVYALLPTVPLRLRDLGAGLAESGRFTATFMVGSGLGALLTGPLGDRLGHRRVLRIATLGAVACFALFATLGRPWMFFALGLPHGILWSGFRTSTLAWVGGHLTEEQRAEGLALFGMAAPGGAAVGPLLGLYLLPRLGFAPLMLALAGLLVGLNAMVRGLPEDAPTARPKVSGYRWPGAWMGPPVVMLVLMALSYGPMPAYAAQEAKALGMVWPSALLASYALGMVAMRWGMGWLGMGRDPVRLLVPMILGTTLSALGLALLPGGLLRHMVCGATYGATFGMVHTLLFTYTLGRARPEQRGQVLGTQFFAYDAGIGLGSFLMGFPMEQLGFRWGWGLGALALALAAVAAWWLRVSDPNPRSAGVSGPGPGGAGPPGRPSPDSGPG